jgi:hypothetical protein
MSAISAAFMAIADYATQQGWTPIGFRSFTVGPWEITVNGTKERCDDVEPYHARVVHQDIIAIMVLHPYGGSVGGWQGAEDQFIADMRVAMMAGDGTDHS